MPKIAAPREKSWTDNLDPAEIGIFGRVASAPEEFFDAGGIRERFSKFVELPKRTRFAPVRGQIVGLTYLRNGRTVTTRKRATHIRYEVEFNPRKEMQDIASKSLGIRENFSPPGLRCRPPRKEILGFQGLENLAQEYSPDPDDRCCEWDYLQRAIDYAEAKLKVRPDLVHPIGE